MKAKFMVGSLLLLGGLLQGCSATTRTLPLPPGSPCTTNGDCTTNNCSGATCAVVPDMAGGSTGPGDGAVRGPDGPTAPPTSLALKWARRFGSSSLDIGAGVAIDNSHDVFLVGRQDAPFDLDGVSQAQATFSIIKLDGATGTRKWSKTASGANIYYNNSQQSLLIATDATGDVLAAAGFAGNLNFACADGSMPSAGNQFDIVVLKFAGSSGGCLWAKQITGGGSDDLPYAITTNSKREVIVTGQFSSTVTFDGMNYTSNGSYDIFGTLYFVHIDGLFNATHRWLSPRRTHGLC